jgi:hypothetical protein
LNNKKSNSKKDNSFNAIKDLLKDKFTGKVELHISQGTIATFKKEEIIKI